MIPRNAEPFIAARDLLLRLRTDYDTAVREFRWPVMGRFSWVLDYFDHLPPDPLALWCIGAVEEKLSFGDLQVRSNQVANHLRQLGVRRGDRVMLLLPNVRQLWEAMLALMKLGAVFSPSPTLLMLKSRTGSSAGGCVMQSSTLRSSGDWRIFRPPLRELQSAARPLGTASKMPTRPRQRSCPMARPARAIRWSCISPPARRRSRNSCCTAIRATRSGC
jgi:hypothetical protein